MNKDISPEERLFNVIHQGEDTSLGQPRKGRTSAPKGFWQRLVSGLGSSKPGEGKAQPKRFDTKSHRLSLRAIKKILGLVLFLLILFLVYKLTYERQLMPDLTAVGPTDKRLLALGDDSIEAFQDLDVYMQGLQEKDIFRATAIQREAKVEEVEEVEEAAPTGPNIQDIISDLSLGGIFEGQNMEAIVEDRSQQKTYFLKQGDEIKGVTVKEILSDRVILQMGDQEADLL